MSLDVARVKDNVAKLVEMGAPEQDIDAYIAEEGTTVEAVKAFQEEAPKERSFMRDTMLPAAKAGAVSGLQTVMELVDPTPMFGMERVGAPTVPDLTKSKDAAGHIIDDEREKYLAGGIGGDVVGTLTEAASNPATWLLGAGGKAKEGVESAVKVGGRIINSAIRGGTQGFATGVGEGESRAANTVIGATAGGAAQGVGEVVKSGSRAAGTGAANVAAGAKSRVASQLDDAASTLKQKASASYSAARDAGAVIAKPTGVNISNRVQTAVGDTGKLNARLHADTLSVMDDFSNAARAGNLGLEELDQFRQLFGDVVKRNTTKLDGANADAMKASVAIEAIDDAVGRLGKTDILGGDTAAVDTLLSARSQWSTFRKFEAVSEIVKQADGDPNKIKAGLKRLLENRKRLRGFSSEEIKGLREASGNSTAEWLAKGLGRFGFEPNNVFMPLVGGGLVSFGSGAGAGVALTVTGTGARYLQKLLGRGKAEKVLSLIESGGDSRRLAAGISQLAGSDAMAKKTMRVISNNIPDKGVRQQFEELANKTGQAAVRVARTVAEPTRKR